MHVLITMLTCTRRLTLKPFAWPICMQWLGTYPSSMMPWDSMKGHLECSAVIFMSPPYPSPLPSTSTPPLREKLTRHVAYTLSEGLADACSHFAHTRHHGLQMLTAMVHRAAQDPQLAGVFRDMQRIPDLHGEDRAPPSTLISRLL